MTVPDARTVLVQPWEKNMIAPIEKAILVANIGLTANPTTATYPADNSLL